MKRILLLSLGLAVVIAGGICLRLRHGRQPIAEPSAPQSSTAVSDNSQSTAGGAAQLTNEQAAAVVPAPNAPASAVRSELTPVQRIVDSRQDYEQRMEALDQLGHEISATDQEALRLFLMQKDLNDDQQLGQVLKNKLMDVLCGLNPSPAWVPETLTQMYHDSDQNVVLRDYAVQHLATYYQQLDATQVNDGATRQAVQNILWEAVHETESSIAGTALLGLQRLSQGRTEFDQGRIVSAAMQMATNSAAGELSRITAFQVCVQMGETKIEPLLLQTAQSGETVPLRISAIAGLGGLADTEAKPVLLSMLNEDEPRLKIPIQRALNQIEKAHPR